VLAQPPKYKVDVFDMEQLDGKGSLKAFANVKVGKSLRVYGFRIIQQANQKAWVSPPQRSWKGDDGKTMYAPIVEVTGDLKAAIDEAVLNAWAEVV